MKDKSLYLLLGIFVLFAMITAIPYLIHGDISGSLTYAKEKSAVCADSDFGKDYASPGEVTDRVDNWLTDWCESSEVLIEYYCGSQGEINSERYVCPEDYACSQGACALGAATCTDSDSGRFYFEKGTVILGDESKTDSCKDEDTVIEYSCSNQEDRIEKAEQSCAYGCIDGACVHSS